MQKINASHGKSKMDKMGGGRYPAFVLSVQYIEYKPFMVGAMSMEKKVMKKQRRSKEENLRKKLVFVARVGVCKSVRLHFIFQSIFLVLPISTFDNILSGINLTGTGFEH
jgi:hypothetical protein